MTRVRLALVTALVLALGVTGVALGVRSEGGAEVRLSEFAVTAPASLPAGETSVRIRNTGRVEHDLVVVRTARAPGELPMGLNGVAPQLAGEVVLGEPHSAHEHGGKAAPRHHYAPGASETAMLELEPGPYVLLCSLPGHYERGQRARLTVR